jgi:hypothetical protein
MDKNLVRAQSLVGTNNDGGRPVDDFYPTPRNATEALLLVEKFGGIIWEPACGDGAISRVLEEKGNVVFSSDLNDHGYGQSGMDFLDCRTPYNYNSMVTNPPFRLADKFAVRAWMLGIPKFAMLCKLQFLEGQGRSKILEETGLSRVWVFRKRIQLTRNGLPMKNGGMIAFAWFVWDTGHSGKTEIGWI